MHRSGGWVLLEAHPAGRFAHEAQAQWEWFDDGYMAFACCAAAQDPGAAARRVGGFCCGSHAGQRGGGPA
eukprot:8741474-Pyramimonas_sp.AAC.1